MKRKFLYLTALMFCLNIYSSPLNKFIRFLNPEINKTEAEISSLKEQAAKLPPHSVSLTGSHKGLHSYYYDKQETALTIILDLEKEYPIDTVALFPASSTFQGEFIHGYGLAEEFTIEASNTQNFSETVNLYKHDKSSLKYGLFPIVLRGLNLKARFIKINITKHWLRSDGKIFSTFGELMVFSGNRNVALHQKVFTDTNILRPKWAPEYLVDGQTDWGAPISSKASLTNGFVSKHSSRPETDKWIVLDLGTEFDIIEVRLIPAQPFDAPDNLAHGFPRNFKIETALNEDFKNAKNIANVSFSTYPGGNAVTFKHDGKARFIKVSASRLKPVLGEDRYALSFSEIQALTNEKNAALNCKISVSDEAGFVNYTNVWSKEYLVDGFNSQNELINLKDWLLAIDDKRQVWARVEELESSLIYEFQTTRSLLIYSISIFALIMSFLLFFSRYQRGRKLKQEVERLRTQISRDLHDDLGSRLGGIRLLSEVALDDPELSKSTKDDLGLIHNSAIGAVEAMRDIVWLTDGKDIEAKELARHLKTVCAESLNQIELSWQENCRPQVIIPFYLRRHLAFAFRESVGNILKHSEASEVSVRIQVDKDEFLFEIIDNGCGFDQQKVSSGNGLANFRQRAKNIKGEYSIDSSPGKGTRVSFKADLQVKL